jgi:hypothetical protein
VTLLRKGQKAGQVSWNQPETGSFREDGSFGPVHRMSTEKGGKPALPVLQRPLLETLH